MVCKKSRSYRALRQIPRLVCWDAWEGAALPPAETSGGWNLITAFTGLPRSRLKLRSTCEKPQLLANRSAHRVPCRLPVSLTELCHLLAQGKAARRARPTSQRLAGEAGWRQRGISWGLGAQLAECFGLLTPARL